MIQKSWQDTQRKWTHKMFLITIFFYIFFPMSIFKNKKKKERKKSYHLIQVKAVLKPYTYLLVPKILCKNYCKLKKIYCKLILDILTPHFWCDTKNFVEFLCLSPLLCQHIINIGMFSHIFYLYFYIFIFSVFFHEKVSP